MSVPSQPSRICVGLSTSSESKINISWDPIPCADITEYIIQYNYTSTNEVENITVNSQKIPDWDCHQEHGGPYQCMVSTSGGDGLNIYRQYTYQVAAVNSYGFGPFSEPVTATGTEFVHQTHISPGIYR